MLSQDSTKTYLRLRVIDNVQNQPILFTSRKIIYQGSGVPCFLSHTLLYGLVIWLNRVWDGGVREGHSIPV